MTGFESTEHQREFWQCLQRRRVPLKFAYAGAAATTHNRLAEQDTYHDVVASVVTEVETIQSHLRNARQLRISEAGPGNGIHTVAFLGELMRAECIPTKYLGLDFSRTLLEIASDRLKLAFPALEVETQKWDFEAAPTFAINEWCCGEPVLALLIGHTLGNPENPEAVLRNFHDSLDSKDLFLLSVALWNDPDIATLLAPYETEIFRDAAMKPLLMAGIEESAVTFVVRFDSSIQSVVGECVVTRPLRISNREEDLVLRPDDRITCFLSRRFSDTDLKSLIHTCGWSIVEAGYSATRSHAAFVLRRQ